MKNNLKKASLAALAAASLAFAGCSSAPASKDASSAALAAEKITFATEGTYSPYSFHDQSGELTGYDVEIARAVAEKIGAEADFIESKWDGIVAGLDAKKFDVIANEVSQTPEREEKYLFSTPYTYSYGVVLVPADSDVASFEDLDGKKVALTTTSNWAKLAESYGAEIVPTNGFSESIQLVEQGRADATVNDNVTWLDYKKQKPDTTAREAAQSDEPTKSGFLLRQDSAELQENINKALDELEKDGTLAEISNKYFGEDISRP